MGFKAKGLKKLTRKLRGLQDLKSLGGDMRSSAIHVRGRIKPYPPKTLANAPQPGKSFYERGYGTRYMNLKGEVSAGSKTSEDLGRQWAIRILDQGRKAIIGNKVTYARFVQSEEKQARFHGRRGWKTDKDVLEQERDFLLEKFQVAIRRELNK